MAEATLSEGGRLTAFFESQEFLQFLNLSPNSSIIQFDWEDVIVAAMLAFAVRWFLVQDFFNRITVIKPVRVEIPEPFGRE